MCLSSSRRRRVPPPELRREVGFLLLDNLGRVALHHVVQLAKVDRLLLDQRLRELVQSPRFFSSVLLQWAYAFATSSFTCGWGCMQKGV